MTILYSNGCSYTANNWVTPEQKYPYLISQALKWDLISNSIPGSCNNRIIRCSMRDILELRQIFPTQQIVALIQLTHLSRFEYAGTKTLDNNWMYAKHDCFQSVKPADEDNWPPEIKEWAKQTILLQDLAAELEQLFCKIIGMISLFNTLHIEYRIFSGPSLNKEIKWPNNNIFYNYLKTQNNILDLEKFSMLNDLTGVDTHPDSVGMQKIANYFISQLCERE